MKSINSKLLKNLFLSGANNLYNHYPEVDALNVFPVPDGDTGINMSLTCTSGANEISNLDPKANCYEVAKTFSHGLLMGARGNSGVITSQIFRGVANYLEEHKTSISPMEFACAFREGSKVAYKAVMRPVEGTILTVIRESTNAICRDIADYTSVEKMLECFLSEARKSLLRTPELLPILKEVGVVDSGGSGLVYIIEGMYLASKGEFVKRNEKDSGKKDPKKAAAAQMESDEFGYCTEFIMSLGPDTVKRKFDQESFSDWLNTHGTSLVVVRDEEIVKVHVHTLTPGEVLNYAQQYGEFVKLKIENMTEQHHALENGVNVEPHEDLVTAEPEKDYAIITVCSGEGLEQFFKEIGVECVISGGQTMNPSSEDFVNAIKQVNAKNVYILPNNSNIVMAATQACDIMSSDSINAFVIPSKTIPQGIVAAMAFNPDENPGNNFKAMKSSLKNVKSGEVTFSIRNCEIKGVKIKKDDFIGIYEKDIVCGTKDKFECLKSLIAQMVDNESFLITIILGADVSREEILSVKKELALQYPEINIEIKQGNQPVYSFIIGVE